MGDTVPAADPAVTIVGRLEALALQPGDVLVVHCHRGISTAQNEQLARQVGRLFPGHRCVVLEPGHRLEAYRPVSSTEPPQRTRPEPPAPSTPPQSGVMTRGA